MFVREILFVTVALDHPVAVASLEIHRDIEKHTKKLENKNTKRQKHTNTFTLLFGLDVSCGLTGDSQVRRSNNH